MPVDLWRHSDLPSRYSVHCYYMVALPLIVLCKYLNASAPVVPVSVELPVAAIQGSTALASTEIPFRRPHASQIHHTISRIALTQECSLGRMRRVRRSSLSVPYNPSIPAAMSPSMIQAASWLHAWVRM